MTRFFFFFLFFWCSVGHLIEQGVPPNQHTITLHSHAITAILKNWDAPTYDGSQDVGQWLRTIETLCRIYEIPPAQMTEVAVKCASGEANLILTAMLEAKVTEAGVWLWADFKESVIQIEDNYRQNMRDPPQDGKDEDFRSQHPYAAAALAVTLIGVGSVTVLPAVTVGILGAIGFGSGGVIAGSIAAGLQSVLYGGAAGGLFAICQSLGATMVAPSFFATFAGAGVAAVGTWLGFTTSTREDPPVVES